MRTLNALVIIPLLAVSQAIAQPEESIVFNYAIDLYEKKDFEEAAAAFEKFMKDFPNSVLKARAHYNVGVCFRDKKDYEKAKYVFLELLEQDYNERDENSLMEPYTLYKHHACRTLAQIALDEKKYDEAENYIQLFAKKYPYQHFCGNEWAAFDMYKAVMLAKVYEGTGRTHDALKELVPHLFNDQLASNEEVRDQLSLILERHFTRSAIQHEMNAALESLRIEKKNKRSSPVMRFFNIEVSLRDYAEDENKLNEDPILYYRKIARENDFFRKYL
jgi:thioredoxin-like negative regulator of GroEL